MVLKELNFNSFHFGKGVVILNELNFKFPLWEGVVFLKEPIFNSFNFGRVWWF